MQYNDKVVEHFMNPRNIGEIVNADGVGTIGSEDCGDMIQVWIKVDKDHLADIKYKVFGCPAAIAACSMMTELAKGKHLDDAYDLTDEQVAEALGGLPEHKYHCSNLAASALHEAITNYAVKSSTNKAIKITVLVDDNGTGDLQLEHGLSFWVEYGGKRVLFDTGQSDVVVKNAEMLDIDLAVTDAIVISHGHYDHTGGLAAVLDIASKAKLYLHPSAIKPKFSKRDYGTESIGMPNSALKAIGNRKVIWTEMPTEVLPRFFVTSRIPRVTDFESGEGYFFSDKNCRQADKFPDDQAIFFDSPKGVVVLLGCAHSGAANTLHYIAKLSGKPRIYAVIGGMHLLRACPERIERTIDALKQYGVQKIGAAHCTGSKPIEKFKNAFSEQCFTCSAGMQIEL
ncbi:MAG: iron-sulfur cluster assembly scaffold protein [Sedimentisphaerales bacterium]|nr:iron-sulfur cluster assembly scaffold protein [Sedimentisphaerales bacterium]